MKSMLSYKTLEKIISERNSDYQAIRYYFEAECGMWCNSKKVKLYYLHKERVVHTSCLDCLDKYRKLKKQDVPTFRELTAQEIFTLQCLYDNTP